MVTPRANTNHNSEDFLGLGKVQNNEVSVERLGVRPSAVYHKQKQTAQDGAASD